MAGTLFGMKKGKEDKDESLSSLKKPSQRIRYLPWVEKYRPATMEDVASQEDVVAVLKKALTGADFPNLLFYGPPGTGKTSTILAICKEMFGKSTYRERILELNASDERGINVVREKVKHFAQVSVRDKTSDGKVCPPFKIIILDEADSMTHAAQAALRRTMEKWTHSTRFCLICNYVSRIIEPITSRCAKFRFKPLPKDLIRSRLELIASAEGVILGKSEEGSGDGESDRVMDTLIEASDGDMRKAITYLQCSYRLGGNKPVDRKTVEDIAGFVDPASIDGLIKACRSETFEAVQTLVKELLLYGYAAAQMVSQIHDYLISDDDDLFTDKQKCVIFEKMAVVDRCLMDGADEYLQILSLAATIMDAQNV